MVKPWFGELRNTLAPPVFADSVPVVTMSGESAVPMLPAPLSKS